MSDHKIQRFVVRGCNSDGWHTEKTKEYPDMQGRWVLFKDHQAAFNAVVKKHNDAVLKLVKTTNALRELCEHTSSTDGVWGRAKVILEECQVSPNPIPQETERRKV